MMNYEIPFFRMKDLISLGIGILSVFCMQILDIFMEVNLNLLWDSEVQTLTFWLGIMIAFDTLTGILAALRERRRDLADGKIDRPVNSQTFWEKTLVKFVGYGVVFVLGQSAYLMGFGASIPAVFLFGALVREGWSLLENLSRMGFKIPEVIKDTVKGWLKGKK